MSSIGFGIPSIFLARGAKGDVGSAVYGFFRRIRRVIVLLGKGESCVVTAGSCKRGARPADVLDGFGFQRPICYGNLMFDPIGCFVY